MDLKPPVNWRECCSPCLRIIIFRAVFLTTLVVRNSHWPIPLVVGHPGSEGTIHRDLEVVGAQAVSVGVRIREEASLKHWSQTTINHHLSRTGACQLRAFTSSRVTNAPQVKPPVYLQHFVRAGLNSRGHVARVISHLFHLCKVVDRIPVQDQLSHRDERVVTMRPNL